MRSWTSRVTAVACAGGLVAGLGMGLLAPVQAKPKKPKPLPDLTAKLLTADEVRGVAKSPGPITANTATKDAKKGQYFTSYAEGETAQLPRYMIGISRFVPTPGGGGTGGGGGGGGGGGRPPTLECEIVEQDGPKTTVLCYDDMMVFASSAWELKLKTGKWTVSATSTKMLIDFETGDTIPLTDAVKDEEVRVAKELRDDQKVKAFG